MPLTPPTGRSILAAAAGFAPRVCAQHHSSSLLIISSSSELSSSSGIPKPTLSSRPSLLPPSSLKASPEHTEQKDEGTGKMSCLAAVELHLKIQVLPFAAPCSPAANKTLFQLAVSTLLNTPVVYVVCKAFLPSGAIVFTVGGTPGVPAVITTFFYSDVFTCLACGMWSGLLIGFSTEYYISYSYRPVRDVAESCRTGAATNIIYGLALGMQSTIVPVLVAAASIAAIKSSPRELIFIEAMSTPPPRDAMVLPLPATSALAAITRICGTWDIGPAT